MSDPLRNEQYIGDGCYASFDGYSFILRAPRVDGDHWIALEPPMIRTLIEYVERTLRDHIAMRKAHLGDRHDN